MKRIGGSRRKTRHKLAKNYRTRGKLSLVKYFQEFNLGDRVCLVIEPSVHSGLFFPRFYGKGGTITGKRGRCYEVVIRDGRMAKTLVVHPIHLKKI